MHVTLLFNIGFDSIPYNSAKGFMYYKSDIQTLQGTRATGQKSNSKYRIPVPRK